MLFLECLLQHLVCGRYFIYAPRCWETLWEKGTGVCFSPPGQRGGRGVRCVPDTGAKPNGDGRGLRSLGLLALLPPALALRTICFCCSRLPVDQQRPHHLQVDEKCRRPSPSPSLRTQTLPWNKGLSQIVRTEVWEALVIFTGSAAMLMLQR